MPLIFNECAVCDLMKHTACPVHEVEGMFIGDMLTWQMLSTF